MDDDTLQNGMDRHRFTTKRFETEGSVCGKIRSRSFDLRLRCRRVVPNGSTARKAEPFFAVSLPDGRIPRIIHYTKNPGKYFFLSLSVE
jgi:hypothetical protein